MLQHFPIIQSPNHQIIKSLNHQMISCLIKVWRYALPCGVAGWEEAASCFKSEPWWRLFIIQIEPVTRGSMVGWNNTRRRKPHALPGDPGTTKRHTEPESLGLTSSRMNKLSFFLPLLSNVGRFWITESSNATSVKISKSNHWSSGEKENSGMFFDKLLAFFLESIQRYVCHGVLLVSSIQSITQ